MGRNRSSGVPRWLIERNEQLQRKVTVLEKEVTRLRKYEKIRLENSAFTKKMIKVIKKS